MQGLKGAISRLQASGGVYRALLCVYGADLCVYRAL